MSRIIAWRWTSQDSRSAICCDQVGKWMAGPGPGGEEAKEEAETLSRARRGVNQTRMEFSVARA
jgi:hypothetical protein